MLRMYSKVRYHRSPTALSSRSRSGTVKFKSTPASKTVLSSKLPKVNAILPIFWVTDY